MINIMANVILVPFPCVFLKDVTPAGIAIKYKKIVTIVVIHLNVFARLLGK